ncbi:hypothetical protein F5Y16DRAFT_403376 [Xylariaceae sp. FL0255]|nr:hypothetical protein F5Y16DRAFT_403376 [Xylariaceae sp. FL0255]
MSTPKPQALQVTELLENILNHVDMKTLLVSAQRVSRFWCHVIRQSPRLQQALFLKPEPILHRTFNPLLVDVFPFCYPLMHGGCILPIAFNVADPDYEYPYCFQLPGLHLTREKMQAFSRPEASWRQMLLQQPPIEEFSVLTVVRANIGWREQGYVKSLKQLPLPGPRMEQLLQYTFSTTGFSGKELWGLPFKHHLSGFRVLWTEPGYSKKLPGLLHLEDAEGFFDGTKICIIHTTFVDDRCFLGLDPTVSAIVEMMYGGRPPNRLILSKMLECPGLKLLAYNPDVPGPR